MIVRSLAALLAGALAGLAIAACGDDRGAATVDPGSTSTPRTATPPTAAATTPVATAQPDQTITVTADPDGELRFTEKTLEAQPGVLELVLENPSTLPHALTIAGVGIEMETPTIRQNGTARLVTDLKPGEYKFFCPVGSHAEAGMGGVLTVE